MLRSKLSFILAALATICLTLAAAPASAQMQPGNVGRVYFTTAKPGMSAEFEAGRKRHVAAHKSMGDTWTWYAFQVETGENAGTYQVGTFGHHWKDFDAWEAKHAEADGADVVKNLDPYSASGSNILVTYLSNMSSPPPAGGAMTPQPLTQLIHFDVKIESEQEFVNDIRKIHEAIQKTKWGSAGQPANYHWYAVVDGGSSPHYVLALPLRGWADMEEPETPFPMMLEKAYGRAEAQAIMESIGRTVKHQYSEVLRYRPDLSYVPSM